MTGAMIWDVPVYETADFRYVAATDHPQADLYRISSTGERTLVRIGHVPARHRSALTKLRADRWLASAEGGVPGPTQEALARLDVAESRWVEKPYRRLVARLTPLGVRYRAKYVEGRSA